MDNQYDLQQEIIEKSGINIVTCGDCGSIILHRIGQTTIVCDSCGFVSEPCDFPDLNVSGTTNEMRHPLTKFVTKQELILEDVFLFGDDAEKMPMTILANSDVRDFPIMFAISKDNKIIRFWELNEGQSIIEVKYREEILKYRLGKVTKEDEVSLGDIFMEGKHTREITEQEWLAKL